MTTGLEQEREDREERRERRRIWRHLLVILGGVVVALFVLLQATIGFVGYKLYQVPTGSMLPGIRVGEHVAAVENDEAAMGAPMGAIVVFEMPQASAKAYLATQPASKRMCINPDTLELSKPTTHLKRLVAKAGQTVELRDNLMIVDGEPVAQEFVTKESTDNFLFPQRVVARETLGDRSYQVHYSGHAPDFGPFEVPAGHVFVVGDNRDSSSDSRCWGPVPVDKLKGRAVHIVYSKGQDGLDWDRVGHGL